MACLNCSARVLRVFIEHSLPSANLAARPALRRPLPRRLPTPPSTLRHQSSLSSSYTPENLLSDDEYIPFVASSLDPEPLLSPAIEDIGQLHRPPPAPIAEFPEEPDVELSGSAQLAADEVVEHTTSEVEAADSLSLQESVVHYTVPETNSEISALEELGLPIVGKETKALRVKKEGREKSRRKDKQELSATSSNEVEPRHKNKWNLPPIEDVASLSPSSKSKLQRIVSTHRPSELDSWKVHKATLERKFAGSGWNPDKRLSPEALEGIRGLHKQHPDVFTTAKLSELFKVSPEAIRRILRSKWRPTAEEAEDRSRRWEKRGAKIWNKMVEDGEVKTKTMKKKEARKRKEKNLSGKIPGEDKWSIINGRRGEKIPRRLEDSMGHRIL